MKDFSDRLATPWAPEEGPDRRAALKPDALSHRVVSCIACGASQMCSAELVVSCFCLLGLGRCGSLHFCDMHLHCEHAIPALSDGILGTFSAPRYNTVTFLPFYLVGGDVVA